MGAALLKRFIRVYHPAAAAVRFLGPGGGSNPPNGGVKACGATFLRQVADCFNFSLVEGLPPPRWRYASARGGLPPPTAALSI